MAIFTINPGDSIQTAINGAADGDSILLNPGTYSNDTILTINKQLTIAWAIPGYVTYGNIQYADPSAQPVVNLNGGNTFIHLINFTADNISLVGLQINNLMGGGVNNGYIWSSTSISNLTISYCDVAFFRRFVFQNAIDGLTFTHNTVHDTRDSALEMDSSVKNINVSYNQFWGETYNYHGEGAIYYIYGADVGTSVIAYNYACSYRGAISVQPQGAAYPTTGTILIEHNTVDMNMAMFHEDPIVFDLTLFGLNFFCNTGDSLNGSAFTVRNNLVTRCKSYAVYLGQVSAQNNLASAMTLSRNLFYDSSWYSNATAPVGALMRPIGEPVAAFQYPEPTGSNGSWGSGGANDMPGTGPNALIDEVNIFDLDPLYAKTGLTPAEFYALTDYSPASKSASDGTNIGAWQGVVKAAKLLQYIPEYASLSWADSLITPLPENKR